MKFILAIFLIFFFISTPVYGQLLSDATGLTTRLDVETRGHTFEIQSTSNFDIYDYVFDDKEKKLTLYINSGLENNLGEVIIPQNFLSGDFAFYLNDQEFFPKTHSNEKISFVTLNFTGSGNNKIDIIGTTFLAEVPAQIQLEQNSNSTIQTELDSNSGGGCLIATATYGTELAPQVQQLREIRENHLIQTQVGIHFINSFNEFYYSFSPLIADLERENLFFKETVKISIAPLISSLYLLNYVDMDSEYEVFGYGMLIILLNVGMYFIAPALVLCRFHKFITSKTL